MNNYGALDVIREESETDDDTDNLELYIRYASGNPSDEQDAKEKIDCVADENSSYHSNYNRFYTDMNTNTAEFRAETDRKRSLAPSTSMTKKPKTIMEPTYRMEPNPDQTFIWYKVKRTLNKLIVPFIASYKYQSKTAGNFCKMVVNKAISTIKKKYEWPRYRYVCHVTLFELCNQGVIAAERSLTYHGIDNCASCLFVSKEHVLIVSFHGVYFE